MRSSVSGFLFQINCSHVGHNNVSTISEKNVMFDFPFRFFSPFNVHFDWLSPVTLANQPLPAMEEGINARWLLI